MPDLSGRWSEVFARPESTHPVDVDQDLYGSFLGDADRSRLTRLRGCDPSAPAWREAGFDEASTVDIVVTVALNVLTNYVNNVAHTDIDFPKLSARLAA